MLPFCVFANKEYSSKVNNGSGKSARNCFNKAAIVCICWILAKFTLLPELYCFTVSWTKLVIPDSLNKPSVSTDCSSKIKHSYTKLGTKCEHGYLCSCFSSTSFKETPNI
eukprot:TRINITY_DN350_c3_g1_i1.p1 TRINITY_DN350_c3_g1~~TRINITY_DN350_c3_g1_i1.p1  ORF type:complete len:110 (-),score=19.93 TRINITY_DN350_c3_g1_i1:314-643(-)